VLRNGHNQEEFLNLWSKLSSITNELTIQSDHHSLLDRISI
jgi:hypothetical protein